MFLWLCIAIRILANPFSNAFQKLLSHKTADPLFITRRGTPLSRDALEPRKALPIS